MIEFVQNKASDAADWFGGLTGFEQVMLVLLALAVFRLGGIRRDLRAIYREIAQPSKLPHFVSRRMPFGLASSQRRAPIGAVGFGFQPMSTPAARATVDDTSNPPTWAKSRPGLYRSVKHGSARFIAKEQGRRDA